MRWHLFVKTGILLCVAWCLQGCDGERVSPSQNPFVLTTPENFPAIVYTTDNNPVTKEGFELGRLLFYDPALSLDSTVACSNCHQQAKAFADPVHRFSKGVNDVSGVRNAPAIQNMAFQENFFWDGGVNHLDFVPVNAITSDLEMHETIAGVVAKLQRSDRYAGRFFKAFGSAEVTSQKMLYALSQFMAMMVSANSRYDRFVRGEGELLTPDEVDGMKLFQSKCATCHATDLFTDGSFRNNGLDNSFDGDAGRERVTEMASDRGKFKVPSLRNAALTAPYMHDGRLATLDKVLEHYRNGVIDSETLDPLLCGGQKAGLVLSDEEKSHIIAFIHTLTDRDFITDKRFSAPTINE